MDIPKLSIPRPSSLEMDDSASVAYYDALSARTHRSGYCMLSMTMRVIGPLAASETWDEGRLGTPTTRG